ncbi:MAG: hypothetical protein U5K79_19670 [Cyclobacteriaceae bacterium]|nr:hypothetical protein [Cyclobacteriaceae bacterium]
MLGVDKEFGKIGLNAFVGGNKMYRNYERIAANGNGFNVDFFPAINNAKTRDFGYGYSEQGINSLFRFSRSKLRWLVGIITATARNDWFSVLNPEFNSIFYPSVGALMGIFRHLQEHAFSDQFRQSYALHGRR